ncbi:hypothetical protein [Halorussus marinus]|uniref:hypothetical protein n=1 Tax=Halorussus marinus TaxID=2505976 RepID=UPI0010929D81|nr:hypothetical protein [Halorussus marinus]
MTQPIDDILEELADQSSPCQRVRRHHLGRTVAVLPSDFHRALRADDRVVVRLVTDGDVIDCRTHPSGDGVLFAADTIDAATATRTRFLTDLSDADQVKLVHVDDSQFETEPDETDDREIRTDGGQPADSADRCGYCDTDGLVYELQSDRGQVTRCIECLAIEQIQQQLSLPFDVWVDRDDIEPPENPDAPDFEPFDPTEHDYKTARAWARILARLKDDDPIIKRDPEAVGTVFEDTREFLTNVMGSDAHKRPSELRSQSGDTDREVRTDGGQVERPEQCPDCGADMRCTHDHQTDISGGETWTCPECGAEEIVTFDGGTTSTGPDGAARLPRSLTQAGTIRFETKRDWNAIQPPIKRSSLGYKEPDVLAIEPVVNADQDDPIECEHHWQDDDFQYHTCSRPADVRVVRNRGVQYDENLDPAGPTGIYSDTYCLQCVRQALHAWVDDQVDRIAEGVTEKRAASSARDDVDGNGGDSQ